jgi:hypothetical protein
MTDPEIDRAILLTAIGLALAYGWYLKSRLDSLLESLDELRDCFDDINPQMRDERAPREGSERGDGTYAGAANIEHVPERKLAN